MPKLRALRSRAIEPFLEDALSPGEVRRCVSGYVSGDAAERFGAFCTTIRYLFRESIAV